MAEKDFALLEFFDFSEIISNKNGFNEIIEDYTFIHISKNTPLKEKQKQKIIHNINESSVIIFDTNEQFNNKINGEYLIIGFEKTIIILEQLLLPLFKDLCSINSVLSAFYLSDKIFFDDKKIEIDSIFLNEIENFYKNCQIKAKKPMKDIWSLISPCLYGYLIKKSYLQQNKFRIEQFINDVTNETSKESICENDYVELRDVGTGSFFVCKLIYHIGQGKLYVIKKPYSINHEIPTLLDREVTNYEKLAHPFLPKYYGRVKDRNYIVIEFINGQTLDKINQIKLTLNEKIKFIFEMMLIFKYFRDNKLIYRDLKPNNVMIDETKTAVLIDFDRLIESNLTLEQTMDLSTRFLAPEINYTFKFTYQTDIFSLGKLIEYIINEISPNINTKVDEISDSEMKLKIEKIINKCTARKAENRPSISEILQEFNSDFQSEIQLEIMLAKYEAHFAYLESIINIIKKAKINPNDPDIQFELGAINKLGLYVDPDINKAIHYFELAANQSHSQSQLTLGEIYYKGEYVERNISKAIHYFELATDQNISQASYNLGLIYQRGKFVKFDIYRAIHYYTLAADLNNPQAQFKLGLIYLKGQYVQLDIQKAIHYFSLASNQNIPQAHFNLAQIYFEGRHIKSDINKAIHYYKLASDHNFVLAQFT